MYEFWSKYHLPIGNSNLPKNHSETSYLLNKLDVLFEMPVHDTTAPGFASPVLDLHLTSQLMHCSFHFQCVIHKKPLPETVSSI